MNPENLKTMVFQCRVYLVAMTVTVIPLSVAGWTTTVLCVVIPAYLALFNLFLICYWGGGMLESAAGKARPIDPVAEGDPTLV